MIEYTVIPSGFLVSGDVDLRQRVIEAIFVPTLIASGELYPQANYDATSAGFLRIMDTRNVNSQHIHWATGAGSLMVPWPSGVPVSAYVRLEMVCAAGSLQTDNRTFTLITRPR